MAIYRYGDRVPVIGQDSYISDSARVIGDVRVGDGCYVGHGAVLRGDYGSLVLGDGTAVEENAMLHVRPGGTLRLDLRVTIGHGAMVHGAWIKSFAVIGIGAVVGFDAVVGEWSIVAEGCVVPQKAHVPDRSIMAGVPGKVVGPVEERHTAFWTYGKQLYVDLAGEYPHKLERIG
jgi:carbonic anhydrase/acetyltransferase-like protein (isoleucine patch superfamily)